MFIKVGWMYKYGGFFPFAWWSLYWFVLDQLTCSLNYYKSPKKPKRRGNIILDGTHLMLTSDKLGWVYLPPWLRRENIFGVMTATRSITLCCNYTAETESWIEVMDMFRPELFNKRMDAAEKIAKCMKFNVPYKKQRVEEELIRAEEERKDVLESHLPIHSRLFGLNDGPMAPHPLSPNHSYPYHYVPRQIWNINPHVVDNLKTVANRALTLLAHSPPMTPSALTRHSSLTSNKKREEANEAQIGKLLGALTETKQAINSLMTKQQEQAKHIQTLTDYLNEHPKENAP